MRIALRMGAACLAVAMTFVGIGVASAQDNRRYDYATGEWVTDTGRLAAKRQMLNRGAPDARYQRTRVAIETRQPAGTVIVDSGKRFLYLVGSDGTALRYGVGVGKDGFSWAGTAKVGRKAKWPGWTPPAAMIRREAAKGNKLPRYMAGGPNNPLGARALYLYRGGRDTLYRIHGTTQPWTIGRAMSSGCIRMMNEDVTDLYNRVPRGARVVVIGPNQSSARVYRDEGAIGGLAALFGG